MAHSRAFVLTRWALLVAFFVSLLATYYHVAVTGSNPGWDFEHYYAGAQIVRAGLGHSLYDIDVQHEFETRYAHGPGGVFNYPAVTALLFLPMTSLGLNRAFLLWTAFSMAITALAVCILGRTLGIADLWWPLFLTFGFYPLQWCYISGQVDTLLLLAFVLALAGLRSHRPLPAGFALALGLIKFHLVLPFVLVMLLRRQWRFLLGFAGGSSVMTVASAAVAGRAQFTAYPHLLVTMQSIATGGFDPVRMPNLRGLLVLVTGREAPFWLVAIIAVCLLVWTAVHIQRLSVNIGIGLALTATLLVAYHSYVYDLVPLIIPLTLLVVTSPLLSREKVVVLALLAVPLLPWLVTKARVSSVLVLPVCLLLHALLRSYRGEATSSPLAAPSR